MLCDPLKVFPRKHGITLYVWLNQQNPFLLQVSSTTTVVLEVMINLEVLKFACGDLKEIFLEFISVKCSAIIIMIYIIVINY